MPTYDFECKKCKEIIERICVIDERGNQKCDKCGELLFQTFIKGSSPQFCIGIGTNTRLSDISPDENASSELKEKWKKMRRVKPANPLHIRTINN